jgi:2-methylcitrate dehydratase PrpD
MSGPAADRAAVERGVTRLLEWVATYTGDIPRPVLRRAAMIIGDDLAATVAAAGEPEVVALQQQLCAAPGRAESTVFGVKPTRTDRVSAALGNGIAASWCELDEGYRLAPCHAGLYVLPALWAEAEAAGLTVAQTLRAAVLAYEVTARFARCWVFPQMTLHPHPQTAAIGGAIAAALVRGFDPAKTLAAVSAASTLITVGGYEHCVEGALVRNVWAAVGASNGMRAADWATCGIGGLARSPYDVFTTLLGQPPAPEHLDAALGKEWAVTAGYHKIHACCQSTHSAVEATLEAMSRLPAGASARDVEAITLESHRPQMSNPEPPTTLASKFSFEHVLATTQVHGNAGADSFSARALVDPEVVRLRHRVTMKKFEPVLPRPNDRPARVTLKLKDGTTIQGECLSARGGPDRPFEERVIVDKIGRIMAGPYPAFGAAMERLLALDAGLLDARWPDFVAGAFAQR